MLLIIAICCYSFLNGKYYPTKTPSKPLAVTVFLAASAIVILKLSTFIPSLRVMEIPSNNLLANILVLLIFSIIGFGIYKNKTLAQKNAYKSLKHCTLRVLDSFKLRFYGFLRRCFHKTTYMDSSRLATSVFDFSG